MLFNTYTDIVNILRRTDSGSASRDSLNNPIYGSPETWNAIYTSINVRLAFSSKGMKVSSTGELIYPAGTLYFSKDFTFKPEDRIIIVTSLSAPVGTEYVIEAIFPSYLMHGVIDHMEGTIHLPVV